jgi:hypothetical protein
MRQLKSRRFIIAMAAISCLTFLGYSKDIDVSSAIAMVAISIAGAGAAEGMIEKKKKGGGNE